jgi:hypothetical protein
MPTVIFVSQCARLGARTTCCMFVGADAAPHKRAAPAQPCDAPQHATTLSAARVTAASGPAARIRTTRGFS